uniref:YSIRK-type signal peptide-containing protein n=2 Tax=unclassified Mammaliicoccus TaxID=2803851 RepID=UPI001EFB15B6
MKKRGRKLDFIPNRFNKYSIRKFTVGTASILVGATLIFGIGEEAKADEQQNSSVQSQSADDNGQSGKSLEEASTEEASTEEKAPEAETTEEATTEEKAPEAETTEEATTEEKAPEAETTEEATTEEKAPEAETTPKAEATNKVASEEPQTNYNNNDYSISQVRDEETAVIYYKKAANVSDEQAREVISNLNLDIKNLSEQELQYELIKALAKEQNNNKPLATALRAVSPKDEESLNIASNELINTLAVTDKSKVIEA